MADLPEEDLQQLNAELLQKRHVRRSLYRPLDAPGSGGKNGFPWPWGIPKMAMGKKMGKKIMEDPNLNLDDDWGYLSDFRKHPFQGNSWQNRPRERWASGRIIELHWVMFRQIFDHTRAG